ncbi:uncharacterized protein LOC129589332 [Paramacrobiotus metropolitanus]|uniref:uncharacterized protein LOC129589332 n=1 Tax=Paramacrobiotus metropolitanus TaxID=2943436 RepID=UPI002445C214|nr:uncharacterized protein LOC129589332 [Paramacrobiotus metropolitanus]
MSGMLFLKPTFILTIPSSADLNVLPKENDLSSELEIKSVNQTNEWMSMMEIFVILVAHCFFVSLGFFCLVFLASSGMWDQEQREPGHTGACWLSVLWLCWSVYVGWDVTALKARKQRRGEGKGSISGVLLYIFSRRIGRICWTTGRTDIKNLISFMLAIIIFALPVEGTETRVNAPGYENMISQVIPGDYGQWSGWSECSADECEEGYQYASRDCNHPTPWNSGRCCSGKPFELQVCNTCKNQEVEVRLFYWTPWSSCLHTCGAGTRIRYKYSVCPPGKDSDACHDHDFKIERCQTRPCSNKVLAWDHWSSWSTCPSLCGGGSTMRFRKCLSHGIDQHMVCPGTPYDIQQCNTHPCDHYRQDYASWSSWSLPTPCSGQCSEDGYFANTFRIFSCGSADVEDCPRIAVRQVECDYRSCYEDVNNFIYPLWSECQSSCSRPCGTGYGYRNRTFAGDLPVNGEFCTKPVFEATQCNRKKCGTNNHYHDPTNGPSEIGSSGRGSVEDDRVMFGSQFYSGIPKPQPNSFFPKMMPDSGLPDSLGDYGQKAPFSSSSNDNSLHRFDMEGGYEADGRDMFLCTSDRSSHGSSNQSAAMRYARDYDYDFDIKNGNFDYLKWMPPYSPMAAVYAEIAELPEHRHSPPSVYNSARTNSAQNKSSSSPSVMFSKSSSQTTLPCMMPHYSHGVNHPDREQEHRHPPYPVQFVGRR